jgi:hypothetical protein
VDTTRLTTRAPLGFLWFAACAAPAPFADVELFGPPEAVAIAEEALQSWEIAPLRRAPRVRAVRFVPRTDPRDPGNSMHDSAAPDGELILGLRSSREEIFASLAHQLGHQLDHAGPGRPLSAAWPERIDRWGQPYRPTEQLADLFSLTPGGLDLLEVHGEICEPPHTVMPLDAVRTDVLDPWFSSIAHDDGEPVFDLQLPATDGEGRWSVQRGTSWMPTPVGSSERFVVRWLRDDGTYEEHSVVLALPAWGAEPCRAPMRGETSEALWSLPWLGPLFDTRSLSNGTLLARSSIGRLDSDVALSTLVLLDPAAPTEITVLASACYDTLIGPEDLNHAHAIVDGETLWLAEAIGDRLSLRVLGSAEVVAAARQATASWTSRLAACWED